MDEQKSVQLDLARFFVATEQNMVSWGFPHSVATLRADIHFHIRQSHERQTGFDCFLVLGIHDLI
jgi:hypothetical protein